VENIYVYEENNPKRITNDLSVTFSFNDDVTLEEADGYITSLLMGIDKNVEYAFDMWTTRKDDDI
tara:strand:+ start:1156 stop:1350 length:195 start_codon:yes stop_codon:yes gene_type:complete